MEIAEEYVIMADRLDVHTIDRTYSIDISSIQQELENALRGVEKREISNGGKVYSLRERLGEKFFSEASGIAEEEPVEDSYIQEQMSRVLPGYEERFRPIIQEYFTRSAKVYGWTKDEFDKKVRNYLRGVKTIRFERKIGSTAVEGFCFGAEMVFSDDSIMVDAAAKLTTYFHEQEHKTDETSRTEKKIGERLIQHNMINEYATEVGSMHLLGDEVYEDKLCFTHKMNGYEPLRYAGSMMSSALGISEFEFARLRDKGNKEFLRCFKEKFNYIDIESELERFNDILEEINNAPSMGYMQQMSEAYAKMYNLAVRIFQTRLAHEKDTILPGNKERFEIKSKYEAAKIANNMNRARRKLHLRDKYIKPLIEDNTTLMNYSRVTRNDRKQYLTLVDELYPEKNVRFDNANILRYVDQEFRHPIRRKILSLFSRKNLPMLDAPHIDENPIGEREDKYQAFRNNLGSSKSEKQRRKRKYNNR